MNNRLAAYWKGLELEPSWQGGMCPGVVLRWPLCHTVKGPILHKNIFTMFSGRNKKVYVWPQGSSLDSWESIFHLFIYFCIYFFIIPYFGCFTFFRLCLQIIFLVMSQGAVLALFCSCQHFHHSCLIQYTWMVQKRIICRRKLRQTFQLDWLMLHQSLGCESKIKKNITKEKKIWPLIPEGGVIFSHSHH